MKRPTFPVPPPRKSLREELADAMLNGIIIAGSILLIVLCAGAISRLIHS